MTDEQDKPAEGVLAQGRKVYQEVVDLQVEMDKYIWPAFPSDVVTLLLLNQRDHDMLKAYLTSKPQLSFALEGGIIRRICGADMYVNTAVVVTDTVEAPDMFSRPKVAR